MHSHRPARKPLGELIVVHGLEGSSNAGYIRSLSQSMLQAGFGVHRFNMRTCGGTESLSETMYHAGLTTDVLAIVRQLQGNAPIYLAGFSLGGNVVLKLAGELGEEAVGLIDGVCAVSTPIDLGACVEKLGARQNILYARRFVDRLKKRIVAKNRLSPGKFSLEGLHSINTVFDFDDRFTAPLFGFHGAAQYYETQSSRQFLHRIAIPTLVVQAKDDPLVPFEVFDHPSFRDNPHLRLIAVDHGGHLGFISKRKPRFWLDGVVLEWLEDLNGAKAATRGTISLAKPAE